MRHETALRRLDELDAGQGYSLLLRLHLSRCPDCADAARRMGAALRAYRAADSSNADDRFVEERVMAAIRLRPLPRQDFALRDWVFPAAVIAASMFLLPVLGRKTSLLDLLLGPGHEVAIALVLGLGFTCYSIFFIATHMSELQTFLEKRGLRTR
jgi:hypothetical protein